MFSCQTMIYNKQTYYFKSGWKKVNCQYQYIYKYIFIVHWVRILLRTINTSGFHEKVACTSNFTQRVRRWYRPRSYLYKSCIHACYEKNLCQILLWWRWTPRVPSASVNISYHRRAAHSITVRGLILFTYKLSQGTYIHAYIWKIR